MQITTQRLRQIIKEELQKPSDCTKKAIAITKETISKIEKKDISKKLKNKKLSDLYKIIADTKCIPDERFKEVRVLVDNAIKKLNFIPKKDRAGAPPKEAEGALEEARNPMTTSARGWDYREPRALSGGDVTGTYDPPRPENKEKKMIAKLSDAIRYITPDPLRVKKGWDSVPSNEEIIRRITKRLGNPWGGPQKELEMFLQKPDYWIEYVLKDKYGDIWSGLERKEEDPEIEIDESIFQEQ